MRRLAHVPYARTYLAGQSLSILGDSALWLALAIWVRELTGSSSLAGLTFFFMAAPSLLAPLWGTLADRVRRRPLLVGLNAAGALLTLALLGVHDRHQVWLIWAVMTGYGVLNGTLAAAQNGLLHTLLPDDLLGDASGLLSTVREGLRLVAPLLGAGLFAVAGGHVVALLDSVTFLVATGSLLRVRVLEPAPVPRPARLRAEVGAGLAHIRRTLRLRQVVVAMSTAMCVVGFSETTGIAVVTDGLHRSATWLGITQAVTGVGALVGGPTVARAMRRLGEGRVCALGLLAFAASTGLQLVPSLTVVVASRLLAGFGLPWFIAAAVTAMLRLTPGPLQGRVTATTDLLTTTPQSVSIAAGAGLVATVGFRPLLVAELLVAGLAGLWLLTRPEQRISATLDPAATELGVVAPVP